MLVNLGRRQSDVDDNPTPSHSRSNGGRSGFGAISGRHELNSKGGINVERRTEVNYDETPDHFDHVQVRLAPLFLPVQVPKRPLLTSAFLLWWPQPAAVIYRSKRDRPTNAQKVRSLPMSLSRARR